MVCVGRGLCRRAACEACALAPGATHALFPCLPPPQDGYEILWIESICEDPAVIAHNVAQLREASPDYVADHDFERRIAFYKKDYVHVQVRACH